MIRIKRVYAPPDESDGVRFLVDRLWPRGVSKSAARIDEWRKDLAPSNNLRKWFDHDPSKWKEFRSRYRDELESAEKMDKLRILGGEGKEGDHHPGVCSPGRSAQQRGSHQEVGREAFRTLGCRIGKGAFSICGWRRCIQPDGAGMRGARSSRPLPY